MSGADAAARLSDTGQLLIRINFERGPGQPGPFDIKIVYKRRKE